MMQTKAMQKTHMHIFLSNEYIVQYIGLYVDQSASVGEIFLKL